MDPQEETEAVVQEIEVLFNLTYVLLCTSTARASSLLDFLWSHLECNHGESMSTFLATLTTKVCLH